MAASRNEQASTGAAAPAPSIQGQVRQRLSRQPLLEATSLNILRPLRKLDQKTVRTVAGDLAARKRNLEDVLLQATRGALDLLGVALREEKRALARETLSNNALRGSLTPPDAKAARARAARAKKNEYVVSGQVLHPGTGEPVSGLVVEASDKDVRFDDFLGAATTDAQGRYEIRFSAKDFKESGEKQPEILVRVASDRRTPLFQTDKPLALEAGTRAELNVNLPAAALGTVTRVAAGGEETRCRRRRELSQISVLTGLQHQAVQGVGAAFKETLERAAIVLERRLESQTGATGKAARASPRKKSTKRKK